MTVDDVIKYFVTGYRFEKQTKLHHSNFFNWKKTGFVPIRTQVKLEKFTKGVLKADLNHLKQEDGILGTNDGSL